MDEPGGPGAVSTVSTELTFDVSRPATLVLQVAVAAEVGRVDESLHVACDGRPVPASVVTAPVDGRQHLVDSPAGTLSVRYEARVRPRTGAGGSAVSVVERLDALRPSRYVPSDRVLGLAAAEFGGIGATVDRVRAICDYVAARTTYTVGASGPTTDAIDTLLAGTGVCRDYAHTVAMLCRAAGVPARLVAVYAPGLTPMDLHAVVEAEVDGRWTVWDATGLAPRPSLIRVATGRDSADTALVTVVDGHAELQEMAVTATAPGDLPRDDHRGVVRLA